VIEKLSKHFGRMIEDEESGPDTLFEMIETLTTPAATNSGSEEPL